MANKNGIANFVRKTDFNNKLKNLNENELIKLSNKKLKINRRLTKDLINKFSILNETKYISSGIFQNYLVVISAKKYIKCFSGTTQVDW